MSEYTHLAEFSDEGLNIGKDHKVLAYLHGLSDFWTFIFEDASKVNLALEANTVQASDIFNKFLQLTSVISLEEISTLTNHQLKLVLISSDNLVKDQVETYTFAADTPVKFARCMANRPFLPTVKLEEGADYFIDADNNTISFSRPLASMGFPFRSTTTGAKEYAIWAVDGRLDDDLIYNHYAKLINIDPTSSSTNFKNFVYGLYYLYVNGPNLATLRKGLNITLGIPLARDSEEVLEIRKYLNTDQYLVITDFNSYVIPYGLEPTVVVGDKLSTGDEIAVWVEVKDYIHDGEWWLNFMLPSHILPNIPTDSPTRNRYATSGSYADWLMQNYLKKHTFLVNVKTVSFKNIQSFEQLASIIKDVKPAYTTPIYVWTVPISDEILALTDDLLKLSKVISRCESLTDGTYRHERDSAIPLLRDCPHVMRISARMELDTQTGYSAEINGPVRSFNGGLVRGFIAPQKGIRALSTKEEAWDRALRTRNQDQYCAKRGWLDRNRSRTSTGDGATEMPFTSNDFPGYRMVYLHTTTEEDINAKFAFVGSTAPSQYLFTLFKPTHYSDLINEHALNGAYESNYYEIIKNNFDYLFERNPGVTFIGPFFPKDSYKVFKPTVADLKPNDFFAFTRITDYAIGVFWITQNFQVETPPYFAREQADALKIRMSGKMTRGMAPMGAPYYQIRDGGANIVYNQSNAINEKEVNSNIDTTTAVQVSYEDTLNPSFFVTRGGANLITERTLR